VLEGDLMLTLEHVSKTYKTGAFGGGKLIAVREVDFAVAPGEVVSLIGESGSGKSTIGRMILRLISVNGGRITFDGTDISTLRGPGLRAYYQSVQGVFQDPFSSFNPVFKVSHVFDMLRGKFGGSTAGSTWDQRVEEALVSVGLEGGQLLHKYPHQLSGGQLQRLLIARALLLETRMLVADEVISMLDASTRIDVLNLLGDLKARGLGILFITHDLSLANYISERAVILRRGRAVEIGPTSRVFENPLHPYTQQLIAAVPRLHEKWGSAPAAGPAERCRYHTAPMASGQAGVSAMAEIEPGHLVACANVDAPCPDDVAAGPRAVA
jgi:oligopeptide/dipeptide ABC transporter ATP-binding protein